MVKADKTLEKQRDTMVFAGGVVQNKESAKSDRDIYRGLVRRINIIRVTGSERVTATKAMHDRKQRMTRFVWSAAVACSFLANSAFGQDASTAERQAIAERRLDMGDVGFRCRVVAAGDGPEWDFVLKEGAKNAVKGATPFLCLPYSKNSAVGLRGSAAVIFVGNDTTSIPVFGF